MADLPVSIQAKLHICFSAEVGKQQALMIVEIMCICVFTLCQDHSSLCVWCWDSNALS